jgi:hypothetical protein
MAREDASGLAQQESATADDRGREKQQKKVGELVESAAHHIHRAKHWDLIFNRRRR